MTDKETSVLFADMHGELTLEEKTDRILETAGFDSMIRRKELVAVKVHVGERGNLGYLNHCYSRVVVDRIRRREAKPFLTDTCTLYSGGRHNAIDHSLTAAQHGFTLSSVGAPFIPADGLRGDEYEELPFDGKHFKKVKIATGILRADKIVFVTHFKAHLMAGFGGSIKNLAMGCASAAGKKDQHSQSQPVIRSEACTACGQCVHACPARAISMRTGKAVIDYGLCIGCGQCVAVCNYHAAETKWDSGAEMFVEKVAEYAAAIHRHFKGKAFYLNFALNITPDCDCWGRNDPPLVQDCGILGSYNPLALDKATLDIVNQSPINPVSGHAHELKPGEDIFHNLRPQVPGDRLFPYARSLGLTDSYELRKIG